MQWNRTIITVFVACGIGGGVGTLFGWNPSTAAPPTDLPATANPNVYEPEVQALLETTYLGHKRELPDPEEPVEVLQKYLEQNAHGYHSQLARQRHELKAKMQAWEALTRQHPQSRHAWLALAKHYRTKAQVSGNTKDLRQAADAYLKAADIGLAHGHILYTRELSEILVDLGDKEGLDEIFGLMLIQPKESNHDSYYLALVDYADGLARLRDDRAWGYFEEAIAFHPGNNEAAINRYARHLLDQGYGQEALNLLDTQVTFEQRLGSMTQISLRKEAMKQIGLDTTSADAEIALLLQRRGEGPLRGLSFSSFETAVGAEATDATFASADSKEGSFIVQAVADARVSAIFAVPPDNPNTKAQENTIMEDAIFQETAGVDGSMNNRWLGFGKKALQLATLKWPNGTAGLVRLSPEKAVVLRVFDGSQWKTWTSLGAIPSGSAVDIAAVAYANGQADVFALANDNCTIYNRHSTNGTTWASWQWWGACGDHLTVALRPDGTGYAAMRASESVLGSPAVVRSFNAAWDNSPIPWVFVPGLAVSALALTAYTTPVYVPQGSKVVTVRMRLWAVGRDDCHLYASDLQDGGWMTWTLQSTGCFKQVSSFNTSDGGAYLLLLGSDSKLYTRRFTGSAWKNITPQNTTNTWIATAGVNIDDDSASAPHEHTEKSDDCRVQATKIRDPFSGRYVSADGVNLAEVMYNEARAETAGAQALVGWTVRNRAYKSLQSPSQCGTYPGAEGGGDVTKTCRQTVACSDPYYCDDSQRICCVVHGGQFQFGLSGLQFSDEHVALTTLSMEGFIDRTWNLLEGRLLDLSNPDWKPAGINIDSCPQSLACGTRTDATPLLCTIGFDVRSVPDTGPMEFLANDYCAKIPPNSPLKLENCKWYAGDRCGDTDSNGDGNLVEVDMHGSCPPPNTSRGRNDNFFWNRQP